MIRILIAEGFLMTVFVVTVFFLAGVLQ